MGDAWSRPVALPGLGHNLGPPLDPGRSSVVLAWRRARDEAWKPPPPEVVRMRMARAAALGLTYREYTAVVMDRGRRLQALLFPLEGTLVQPRRPGFVAGRPDRPMPGVEARLRSVACLRRIVVAGTEGHAGLVDWVRPEVVVRTSGTRVGRRDAVLAALRQLGIAPGEVAVIGAHARDRTLAGDIDAGLFVEAADWFSR
ncbi:MAG: hypothetical protein VYB54_07790 [Pseudomonadota bacterium]|nr:hypothetical protein [Pseudomonadota bacterium]